MTLYHFTAAHLVKSILRRGITMGCIPRGDLDKPKFDRPYQWLTCDPDPKQQEWDNSEFRRLPYSRTAIRMTVEIPTCMERHLHRWLEIADPDEPMVQILNSEGNPDDWWVYAGRIPARWIIRAKRMVD